MPKILKSSIDDCSKAIQSVRWQNSLLAEYDKDGDLCCVISNLSSCFEFLPIECSHDGGEDVDRKLAKTMSFLIDGGSEFVLYQDTTDLFQDLQRRCYGKDS